MAKKILITGASGMIGTQLTDLLLAKNNSVAHLGRNKKGIVPSFVWDASNGVIDKDSLRQTDTIVHLAGANVAGKRWTKGRKNEILESRVKSAELLFKTLENNPHTIQTFISASAIGYYGFGDENKIFTEEDKPGNDFLAQVTKHWEEAADQFATLGIRTVKIRIGIVLSKKGGALHEMTKPIKFGVGSPLGTGKQFLSWIHVDDLCGIFMNAIEDEKMNGAYNATVDWCTNEEMTKAIARSLHRPLWLPSVPSFILKIILGEMADIVLNGSKVSSEKIKNRGFQFKFSKIENALDDLLSPSPLERAG